MANAIFIASLFTGLDETRSEIREVMITSDLSRKEKEFLKEVLEKKQNIKAYDLLINITTCISTVAKVIGWVFCGIGFFLLSGEDRPGMENQFLENKFYGIIFLAVSVICYLLYYHTNSDRLAYELEKELDVEWMEDYAPEYMYRR